MNRVLYISDVPPYGESRGGAVIVYRLLKSVPANQLVVLETNYFKKDVDYNSNYPLPGVKYLNIGYPLIRLRNTRLTQLYSICIIKFRGCFYKKLEKIIRDYNITKIITVSHGYMYYIATGLAQKKNIRCFAIHHDLYSKTINIYKDSFVLNIRSLFANAYKHNTINFCISPFMQTAYDKIFSGNSVVLYPNRDIDAFVNYNKEHSMSLSKSRNELTFAYVGTITSKSVLTLIESFSNHIGQFGHKLKLLSNVNSEILKSLQLKYNNLTISPWIASDQLLEYLCCSTDVLLLLQDNEPESIDAISINFPSKLTDYTQTGLPILIIGPKLGSAYKFGKLNDQAFWTISADGIIDFDKFNQIFAEMRDYKNRVNMGIEASLIGERIFSFSNILENFLKPILTI